MGLCPWRSTAEKEVSVHVIGHTESGTSNCGLSHSQAVDLERKIQSYVLILCCEEVCAQVAEKEYRPVQPSIQVNSAAMEKNSLRIATPIGVVAVTHGLATWQKYERVGWHLMYQNFGS